MAAAGTWVKRGVLTLLALVLLLVAVVVGVLLWFKVPSSAMGMAAKGVCSAAFVAGRAPDTTSADNLMEEDILPASPVLSLVDTEVDLEERSATARLLWVFSRTAWLNDDRRGCVLDSRPDTVPDPYAPGLDLAATWPLGDAPVPATEVPAGVDDAALQAVVDEAFVGAGDPAAANARAVAVVQDGRLLVRREAPGFEDGVALHGWSMTKTVTAMAFYRIASERGLDIQTPVVDAFPADREPEWVAEWREDERADITVADLLFMRDGLDNGEGYDVFGEVPRMLWSEDDMAAWAASKPSAEPAGERWKYLSATSNILAAVTRAQFDSDAAYWAYVYDEILGPIGLTSATLESDTAGTDVASSYLWADAADWARLGQFMLQDGVWDGRQVLPPGWLELADTPAMSTGEGAGYGAQTWRYGDPVGGDCKDVPGVPEDTLAMSGHWGQLVAMVPSRDAVIVRMGWTVTSGQFDDCRLISDVLETLAP